MSEEATVQRTETETETETDNVNTQAVEEDYEFFARHESAGANRRPVVALRRGKSHPKRPQTGSILHKHTQWLLWVLHPEDNCKHRLDELGVT